MSKILQPKKIFNQESKEATVDARIINGNPNGVFNYNSTSHAWAVDLYDKMLDRTWFPKQVDLTKDAVNYPVLSPEYKRAFDLVLAQLIADDSIQTNQLVDRINMYITSTIVNACVIRQSFEESLHSQSYAVIAETVCIDIDRIYNMKDHDPELYRKNQAVEDMYMSLYDGDEITAEDFLLAAGANQVLEELVFPGGFVVIHSMDHVMPGSSEMIAEINSGFPTEKSVA